jgi:signal transduction histidine kinase
MTGPHGVDLVRPLARRTAVVATTAAVILTLGTPLALYGPIRRSLRAQAASYASRMAAMVRDVVATQPELWAYDTPKLAGHLQLIEGPEVAQIVVIDAAGRRVDVPRPRARGGPSLLWWAAAPVYRGDQEVARVWVAIDAGPGMARVALALVLSYVLGAALSTLLFIVPVVVVSRAERRIAELLVTLDGAQRELADLNAELEARVDKRSRQLADTAEALRRSEARLREVAGRAVEATELERQRVARELHDGAGQTLTAIRLSLQVLAATVGSQDQAGARLSDAERLVDELIDEIRRIAMDLHPAALDRLGLSQGLAELCSGVAARTKLAVRFQCDLAGRLPAAVESSCYRVVQECLTNVVRSAEARSVAVVLERVGAELTVRVTDDGRGFDPSAPRVGLGLRGMGDRAALLGGTLSIESAPGRGTTVEVKLPIGALAATGETEREGAPGA